MFAGLGLAVQLNGIGASSKKRVSRFQTFREFPGVKEIADFQLGFFVLVPFTFPHFNHGITSVANGLNSVLSQFVDLSHGHVIVFFVTNVSVGETSGAPVVKTPLKLIHRLGGGVKPVHVNQLTIDVNGMFSLVMRMYQLILLLVSLLTQLMVDPIQPFHRGKGMGLAFSVPSTDRFRGNGERLQTFFSVVPIASGCDGDALFHGVELSFAFEFFLKLHASFFEKMHVGLAVSNQFFVKVEFILFFATCLVPGFKGFFPFGFHARGVVIILSRHGSHVLLMFKGVEKVREKPFFEFLESKRRGEIRQCHL